MVNIQVTIIYYEELILH